MDHTFNRSLNYSLRSLLLILPGAGIVLFATLIPIWRVLFQYPVSPFGLFNSLLQDPVLFHMLMFTLRQAALSAVLSGVFSLIFGYFLWRKQIQTGFLLRGLGSVIFSLPPVVIAFACIITFGNNGIINKMFGYFDLHVSFLYRESAVVWAHVYFNVLQGVLWVRDQADQIPAALIDRARVENFSWPLRFWYCEFPYLWPALWRFIMLVFQMSLNSYAIPLMLGGGPANSTLELGVYEALRIDMNPERAVNIALLQLIISGSALFVYRRFSRDAIRQKLSADRGSQQYSGESGSKNIIFFRAFLFFMLFMLGLPVFMAFSEGLCPILNPGTISRDMWLFLWSCTVNTLHLAICSAALASLTALCLSLALSHSRDQPDFLSRCIESCIQVLPGFSPMALSLGFYFSWKKMYPEWFEGPWPVVLVYTCSALPWCWWKMHPTVMLLRSHFHRQKAALNLGSAEAFFRVDLPALYPCLVQSFICGLAPAIGNLSVISFLAPHSWQTLSGGMNDLMAAYQFQEASLFASALFLLTFMLVSCTGFFAKKAERMIGD